MQGVRAWMISTSAREAWRRAANFLVRNRDQDVFLWVHFFDPHGDYQPHPGISDQFIEQNRGPSNGLTELGPGDHYSPEEVKYIRDLYAGEIFYMDLYLGRLIDLVSNLEPRAQRPPLILITADHGEFMGEYQDRPARIGFGHGPLFNPGIYIPMLLSCPGVVPAGKVVADAAESVDVAPTLLDYALDFRTYPGQGQSLRPVIEGRGHTDQLAVSERIGVAQPNLPIFSVVSGSHKFLVLHETARGPIYDLDRDFGEQHDLRPLQPELGAQSLNDYREWLKRTPATTIQERKLTPAETKALRALGYVE
jgi:arylsulfatase A-like enzyme